MQDNLYSCYLCYQGRSGLHHPERTPVNSADSIDITSMSTYTDVPVNLHESRWWSAVAPIIGNGDPSLTALASVAENFGRVAHASCHQTALGRTLPPPLASWDYSTDAHLRPRWSPVEAETAHAYAPQTAWDEARVTLMQPSESQVPSWLADLDAFGESWSQGGYTHHAVAAPAQPASLRNTSHPPHPVPAQSYMAASSEASSSSQAHMTSLSNVNSWIADAMPGTPSPANHRQCHRRPRARLEYVICDKCEKSMRRQSYRRHVREVHHHIRRRHAKSSFPVEP